MTGIIVGLIEVSMLITYFITLPLLFLLRLLIALKSKKTISKIVLITILPFSLGYYHFSKEEERPKIYEILVIVFSCVALIGISFTLFQLFFH